MNPLFFMTIKLFAHRGFTASGANQNSTESLHQAHKNDFLGIEFDIWFVDGKLLLKHDEPTPQEIPHLPNLSDYFEFGNDFSYWMDFKNLDEKNAARALSLVKKNIDEAKIELKQINFAPFITNYELAKKIFAEIRKIFGEEAQLVAVCEELETSEEVKILREFLTQNNVKFLSIFHQLIDKNFVETFSDIELFAWTVNDEARIDQLSKLGVKNFATDKLNP